MAAQASPLLVTGKKEKTRKEKKEKSTLFSDQNRRHLRRQPGALVTGLDA